jgi:hypothetical protein
MWKRLRRRTLAPGRPAIHPEQLGLVLISIIAIAAGVWVVLRIFQ